MATKDDFEALIDLLAEDDDTTGTGLVHLQPAVRLLNVDARNNGNAPIERVPVSSLMR